ncbi:hypothetical protein ACH5RR_029990 [Cinchona calisaya]|uniref:Uncharacterized protein n=1 Tax=Cinchona calisaya TaxID=153742 RepID=A0ABD2YUR0_9GENT
MCIHVFLFDKRSYMTMGASNSNNSENNFVVTTERLKGYLLASTTIEAEALPSPSVCVVRIVLEDFLASILAEGITVLRREWVANAAGVVATHFSTMEGGFTVES